MPIFKGQQQSVVYNHATGLISTIDGTLGNTLPVYTWEEHPNPWDVPFGTIIRIHPSCLTGSNPNSAGFLLASDNVNWKPIGAQTLYSAVSSIATPLVSGVTGVGVTSDEVSIYGSLVPMVVPRGLPYRGCRFRFKVLITKTGGADTWKTYIRMGNQVAFNGNDPVHEISGLTNANGRQCLMDTEIQVTSAGMDSYSATPGFAKASFTTNYTLTPNGQGTNAALDKTGAFTTLENMNVHINIKGDALDTFNLINYSLEMLP